MRARVRALIVVDEGDPGRAEAIVKAMRPDDAVPRENLRVEGWASGESILYFVEASGGPEAVLSARNTLDDILDTIETLEKIVPGGKPRR